MLRIGQVEATATQDGKYTDGSVAGGIAATRLRAAAFNAMQEELAHIVESAGLALDINDMTQVLKAIQKLTLSRANPFADIKSDGAAAISTALTNLGISDEITRAAAAIVHSGDSVTNLNNAPQNSSVFAYGSAANSPGFNATILTVSSLNDSFDMQIAIGYNPVKVAFRSKNGDTSSWQSWLVLGAAASRDVGTAANQIPDMSNFEFQNGLDGGYVRFPQGWILQWSKVSVPAATGTTGATISSNYFLPFPSSVLGSWANVESRTINVAASPFVCASNNDRSSFLVTSTYKSSSLSVMVYSIGR